jgi:hypothetical protein
MPKWILKNWGLEGVNSAGSGNTTGVGCFETSFLIKGGGLYIFHSPTNALFIKPGKV